jgi:hypothetical protein
MGSGWAGRGCGAGVRRRGGGRRRCRTRVRGRRCGRRGCCAGVHGRRPSASSRRARRGPTGRWRPRRCGGRGCWPSGIGIGTPRRCAARCYDRLTRRVVSWRASGGHRARAAHPRRCHRPARGKSRRVAGGNPQRLDPRGPGPPPPGAPRRRGGAAGPCAAAQGSPESHWAACRADCPAGLCRPRLHPSAVLVAFMPAAGWSVPCWTAPHAVRGVPAELRQAGPEDHSRSTSRCASAGLVRFDGPWDICEKAESALTVVWVSRCRPR